MRAFGWNGTFFNESEMALFSECMLQCARNRLDTADIVRDACFQQSSATIASQFTKDMPLFRPLKHGIEIEVLWSDQDVLECQFSCSNGWFSGAVSIYIGHDDLSKMVDQLNGFPFNVGDSRDFELGTFDANYASGGIRMHFHCLDSRGHAAVDVHLRGHACKALGEIESVALRIRVEAAGIDSFLAQVAKIDTGQSGLLHI